MNRSLPRIVTVALCFLSAFHAFPGTLPFSLKITDTVDTDLALAAKASFESALLDGRIAWNLEDLSDADEIARSKPETWSLCAKPLSGVSVRAGSVSYGGFPARANNAVFSISSPFHAPLEVDDASLLSAGSSRKTGTVAAEIRSGAVRVTAFSSLPEGSDGITWLSASSTWRSFSERDAALSLALFSGTGKIPEPSDNAWTVTVPSVPGSDLFVSGGECVFRFRELGGSATLFANAGRARAFRGMGRAEFYVDAGPLQVASGYYRRDREYRELDGSIPSVLSRFYASPQLELSKNADDSTKFRAGAILSRDVLADEKFWLENRTRTSAGIGISMASRPVDVSAKFMATEETLTADASLKLRRLVWRTLNGALSGTVTWERRDGEPPVPDIAEPRTSLAFVPVNSKRARTRIALSYKGKIALPDSFETGEYSLSIEQSFPGKRCFTTISLGATLDAIELEPAGALTVTLAIR